MANTILILGDSTSMTIGLERQMHPFHSATKAVWPEGTQFVNCSLPGFTSADAAAFFFWWKSRLPNVRAVVIYLGNCDTTAIEIQKGRYTPARALKDQWRKAIGAKNVKTSLRNRLLHFEWNNAYNPHIEAPADPQDFEYNLRRVVNACAAASIPVVLVRPVANLYFLPGVGKGNFVFYRYIGVRYRVADRIQIPDARFPEALGLQESGDAAGAMAAYKEILLNAPAVPMHPEYALLVSGNYAAAAAEAGQLCEAEHVSRLLLKERAARREIVLYNLAQILKRKGDEAGYEKTLNDSYEADESLYRIRSPYVEAIDRVAASSSVKVVDLRKIVTQADFIDHCHPVPAGQERISDVVCEALKESGVTGSSTATVQNILTNPEMAVGNDAEFYAYFKTYAPFSDEQIRQFVASLRAALKDGDGGAPLSTALESYPREFRTAIEYHLRHPSFPSAKDLLRFGPVHPSDVGRFPEFFLFRHLIPYLRVHEREAELRSRFQTDVLRSSAQLLSALPEPAAKLVSTEDPAVDADYESVRLPFILSRVRTELRAHLLKGNQVYERMKTTIFWYVRETLRFGSHSRYSMRYDRVSLEYLAEALVVAGVIDRALGGKEAGEIQNLVSALDRTVSLHEDFARRFTPEADASTLLAQYDAGLSSLADQLEPVESRL